MSLFDAQKKIIKSRMKTNMQVDALFRLELDGQPDSLDLFTKEVSYGKGTIESESLAVSIGSFNIPDRKPAGSVTVVFNDDETGTASDFISSLQKKIFNDDGTQNLPVDYLVGMRIYRILSDGSERLDTEWRVYVEENNDYSGNTESVSELGTFSVTFKKFQSIGK